MLNEKRSEKVTDEEMDEMIQIVEVAHNVPRYAERIAEQIAARTCRKEQTVEAMKMIPQERVSKRIVKQIMALACHKWQEQNVKDSKTTQQVVNRGGNSTDFGARRG